MVYHTCQNSKFKYLFLIFEYFPTKCFQAPLATKWYVDHHFNTDYNVNTCIGLLETIAALRFTHNKYSV